MGYPNIIYGDYGHEKKTHSAAPGGIPLGQLMVTPDGRKFRLAQAGSATALTAGVVVSTTAAVTGHGAIAGSGLLASATTTYNLSGHTDVYLTTKSVAVTLDQYAGGLLNVQLSAGNAEAYKIKGNDSAAASSICKFTLEPTDPLKVAFAAGSTGCSLRKNPYKDAIVHAAGTVIAGPMGVTPVAVSVNYYFWVQRSGPASVRQAATVVTVGQAVMSSTATAGSVTLMPQATAGSISAGELNAILSGVIGLALEAPSASEAALVDLTLER